MRFASLRATVGSGLFVFFFVLTCSLDFLVLVSKKKKGSENGLHHHIAENRKGRATAKELRKKKAKAKAKGKTNGYKIVRNLGSRRKKSGRQTKPICMRYNLLQCTVPKCTVAHCCPVLKSDGSKCGSTDHRAIACPHRSRKNVHLGTAPDVRNGDRRREAAVRAASRL